MTRLEDRTELARLGWLITTVGMAVILVVGSWLNYRVVRAAVDTLNLGQAELLGNAMRTARSDGGAGMDAASLQEILDTHAASGLRYLAVIGPDDTVLAEAGSKVGPLATPRTRGPGLATTLVAVGERVRSFQPRPPQRPPPMSGDAPPPREGREGASWDADVRGAYWNVVEFEPLAADVLAGGRRSLGLSCLAALLLVSLALLSWRASERADAARRAMDEQQHLADLGQMSAVLAHEIRNPLASLKGNAQLVAEQLPSGSPDRKRVDRVVSEANRLEALTADLLDFARTGPLRRSDSDPLEMIRQLVEDVGGGPYEVESGGSPRSWALDVARIRQALLNVLINAREASGAGPVRVRVDQGAAALVFEVFDSGSGLPPGAGERIFDPFFTTRTSGTGLGLAVARSVVRKHGGRIEATNQPGGGAVFRITLPATERA
ncbi:MAG TPA: ATP-binding protein [Longimicrobiales bacterium]|nr:ATP-binding protein [Longimicrobiales bacterium]